MILSHFNYFSFHGEYLPTVGYFTNYSKLSLGEMSSVGKTALLHIQNNHYMTTRGNYKYFFPIYCIKEPMV